MAIRIAAVKTASLSDDKKEVIVATSGKYTGDLELRFAHECLDDLIDSLIRARNVMQPAAPIGSATRQAAAPVTEKGAAAIRMRSASNCRRISP